MSLYDHLPPAASIEQQVELALAEDVGSGDISALLIPSEQQSQATLICRDQAVISGIAWFDWVFHRLNSDISIKWRVKDGDHVEANSVLCTLSGNTRALLTGERTALNFLQTLSGTATMTYQYVKAANNKIRILDTRKTIPGLRLAQKYAVLCGQGSNHRIGLYDAYLLKENHIAAKGSISVAVAEARKNAPDAMIEVEVENLTQVEEAISCGVERLLLDNMDRETLKQAIEIAKNSAELEISGGVDLDSITELAKSGCDYISIGNLTKLVVPIDLSMRINT